MVAATVTPRSTSLTRRLPNPAERASTTLDNPCCDPLNAYGDSITGSASAAAGAEAVVIGVGSGRFSQTPLFRQRYIPEHPGRSPDQGYVVFCVQLLERLALTDELLHGFHQSDR